jgi:hypothetical protein
VSNFSAFLDASGKPEDSDDLPTVAAGFIATVAAWEHFERSWNTLLAEYTIPYLQMSALHARKKPFDEDRWNDAEYMASFLDKAGRIVRSHVLAFSAAGVKNGDFRDVCKIYDLRSKFNEYALMGTATLLSLKGKLNILRPSWPAHQAQYFVEEGDDGVGYIQDVFRGLGLDEPIRRSGKPQKGKLHLVQFQACDWLAFETRKFGIANPTKSLRICHRKLLQDVPGTAHKWTRDDLVNYCERKNIRKVG